MATRKLPRYCPVGQGLRGEVYFWDESGFRADTVHPKSWGVKGHTPVVDRPGQRHSINAASAVNAPGAFW